MIQINQIALITNSSRHSQSSSLVKFFSEPHWLIAALITKDKPDYYFNNNYCYNKTSVHIIRTVILNCHVTHG